ncbi:PREDICTED: inactive protein RESTRICTED TEV MOVEMENT 2 isoform X2 [Tarenaya hassleriana]|uniref:inactive protein RESTRICTED TEV MOVEMENT 2 isoform X1 n=1 Tax=Tarenaya hassleriana TaxID=28532 RepID=UPI00053C95CC|nr:PREDICTED: inactive protein RESTRICTED TEV MOVEMENT 2 isoform X1 [Tarenaya hassleriana]XP_010521610.1 PREDICTED: inactive protein RESTRICTED TEV MOVEMENT 2 isoform X2 [Tarenaya hassleriana]
MEKKFNVSSDRVYDEFEPMARWTPEPGFENLTVYLPGFKKEQLKVQVTSTRKLRVMGERHAGGNKWIRFRKEFPVQPNVDVDAISAKFEGVNLVLKLPRSEPKDKQLSSGRDGSASKPPVHQEGPKPPVQQQQQLPKAKGKETEKVQERPKPLTEKAGLKEETSEKVPMPKPAMEKPSEKESGTEREEGSRDDEKVKEKEKTYEGTQILRGYLREMKNKKRAISVGLVVAASMVVFSLGIFAGKRLWCSFEG